MKILLLALLLLTLGCASFPDSDKSGGNVSQVKKWYADYRTQPGAWPGIAYQGTDSNAHHFVARQYGDWVFIKIRKSNLKLSEELPLQHTSTIGYYLVDPLNKFRKIDPPR